MLLSMKKRILAMILAVTALLSVFAVSASAKDSKVDIKLWHATKDKASMAQVLGDKATVTEKDGKIYMTVTTKSMEMMGIKGDLTALRVSDGHGGYVDATVTGKDKKGLPTGFTFPVDAKEYKTGFIPVQEMSKLSVNVDAMNGWQDARIKIGDAKDPLNA